MMEPEFASDNDEDASEFDVSSEEDDEDYVPAIKPNIPRVIKKKKKLKRKKRARSSPDMTELSLPKPASRLSNDLDLSGSALNRSFQMEHEMTSMLGVVKIPKDLALQEGVCARTIKGWKVTRSSPDDPGIAQYRDFYAKQLPGMPYYDDSYHVTLTLDGTARQVVSAAATFDFVDLTTNDGTRVLILDVLALAVNPGSTERRGVGSQVVNALKAICRQEAHLLKARPLLLTQADLACVGFWGRTDSAARSTQTHSFARCGVPLVLPYSQVLCLWHTYWRVPLQPRSRQPAARRSLRCISLFTPRPRKHMHPSGRLRRRHVR